MCHADVGVQLVARLVGIAAAGEVGVGVAEVAVGGDAGYAVVGHHLGEVHRVDVHRCREEAGGGLLRVVSCGEVAAESQVDGGGFGGFQVEVGGVVVAVVAHVGIVVLHLCGAGQTPFVVIAQGDVVGGVGHTATHAHVHTAVVSQVVEELVHPVDCRIEVWVEHRRVVVGQQSVCLLRGFDVLRGVEQAPVGIHVRLVGGIHIGIGVGKLRAFGQGDKAFVVVQVELRLAHLSRFGLDDDYAVGAAHTVNGCGGGVFQHGERFDVFGVDVAETTFHTVYQHQRLGVLVGEGGDTANPDVGVVVSRLARALHGYHTCQTACDGGGEVGGGHLDVVHLHG